MHLVSWPESQDCMGCEYGEYHVSDSPAQYLCKKEGECARKGGS